MQEEGGDKSSDNEEKSKGEENTNKTVADGKSAEETSPRTVIRPKFTEDVLHPKQTGVVTMNFEVKYSRKEKSEDD